MGSWWFSLGPLHQMRLHKSYRGDPEVSAGYKGHAHPLLRSYPCWASPSQAYCLPKTIIAPSLSPPTVIQHQMEMEWLTPQPWVSHCIYCHTGGFTTLSPPRENQTHQAASHLQFCISDFHTHHQKPPFDGQGLQTP